MGKLTAVSVSTGFSTSLHPDLNINDRLNHPFSIDFTVDNSHNLRESR